MRRDALYFCSNILFICVLRCGVLSFLLKLKYLPWLKNSCKTLDFGTWPSVYMQNHEMQLQQLQPVMPSDGQCARTHLEGSGLARGEVTKGERCSFNFSTHLETTNPLLFLTPTLSVWFLLDPQRVCWAHHLQFRSEANAFILWLRQTHMHTSFVYPFLPPSTLQHVSVLCIFYECI